MTINTCVEQIIKVDQAKNEVVRRTMLKKGLPTPTSQIYVGVGGKMLALPTHTSYIYVRVGRECTAFSYTYNHKSALLV